VDPRDILDTMVKRKIPSPRRESNPSKWFIIPYSVIGIVVLDGCETWSVPLREEYIDRRVSKTGC
jgi:hypothetical protein